MKKILIFFLPLLVSCSSTSKHIEVYYRDGFTEYEDMVNCLSLKAEASMGDFTDTISITEDFYNEVRSCIKENNDSCRETSPLMSIKIGDREICIHKDGSTCCSDSTNLLLVYKIKSMFGYYDMISKSDLCHSPEIKKYGPPKKTTRLNSIERERAADPMATPPHSLIKKVLAKIKNMP